MADIVLGSFSNPIFIVKKPVTRITVLLPVGGPPGPSATDPGIAQFVAHGTETGPAVDARIDARAVDGTPFRIALDGEYVGGKILPAGNPALTLGEVIAVGRAIGLAGGVNTVVLVGDGAPNYENVIGGVLANVNTASSNIPAGGPGTGVGALVSPSGSWNTMLGGYDNVTNGWATVVLGFHNKIGDGANHITISGGSIHDVAAAVQHAVISGGTTNHVLASADYAVIGGGAGNTVSAIYAAIGGGLNAVASARSATVAGGEANSATATYTSVGGGLSNLASASAATVAGGQSNIASGVHSFVAGRDNTANIEATVATGRGAIASVPGERAHSSSVFAAQGDAQHRQFIMRNQTTNATPTRLFANAAATSPMFVGADTTWAFTGLVAARRTDVDGESAGYKFEGVLDRHTTGASIAFVGTPTVTALSEDNAAWDCALSVDITNGSLIITVTGEAAKTVRWVAHVSVVQVSG